MEKNPQEMDVQLNMDAPVEKYELEDILREFGGWTEEPEEEALPEPEDPGLMRVAAEPQKERQPLKLIDLSGETIRFSPITEEQLQEEVQCPDAEPVEMPEEPEVSPEDKARLREAQRARRREDRRLHRLARQRKKALRAQRRAMRRDEPEVVYPSAEEACAAYAKGGTLRLRLIVTAGMFVIEAILLILSTWPLGALDLTGNRNVFSILMLAVLMAQCLLSADVCIRGVYQALRLKFDLTTLMDLAVLVTVMDAFFAIPSGRTPFCPTASLALLVALRSVSLEKKAKWRTLKTVLSMEKPVAAVKEEKAWRDLDCIFRQEGSLENFTAMLEAPDAAQKTMRVYGPLATVLTFVLAVLAALEGTAGFWWAWSALLTAALPVGGFMACCRPFSRLADRLSKSGAAICGWRGAKILSGECGIVMGDNDLFPVANITMNGMKMYSDLPVRQVVGYATAVIQAAGSGLLPLFEQVMKDENARRYSVDTFRQYEGGGLGAEIRGDVVLLGSLAFMRLMGVQVPEGTRVQSAVYISVNKELVGVFALSYAPASGSKAGLHEVLRSSGLTPILATRDFMITPGLVKKRYKVSADRLEFPLVAERAKLSAPEAGKDGLQGALMAKDSFSAFAAAVTGGRQLRRTVHSTVLVTLLSGLMGMGLMFLLTYLDAVEAVSVANLLLYQLLWLVPVWMLTGLIGKS